MIANESVNRAIGYVLAHITEDISVDEVAGHCHFSKHYFSRVFKAATGESIHTFIKRVKLEQSAFRLKVEQNRSVTEIGSEYGYSASNYSSMFKQHHALSPIAFRRRIASASLSNPIFADEEMELEPFAVCAGKISVEQVEDRRVIYQRRIGNYGDLSADWGSFQDTYREYITEETVFLERTYDDPAITDVNECLYDICMSAPEGCRLPNTDTIRGGAFAVYHFNGPVCGLYAAYQSLFRVWLPQSGFEIDDRYGFERYRSVNCDTMEMEIDLCIPVK